MAAGSDLQRLGAETKQAEVELAGSGPKFLVEMATDQPGFAASAVDSLGTKKLDGNMMLPLAKPSQSYKVSRDNQTISYRLSESEGSAAWTFEFSERGFVIRSTSSPNLSLQPLMLSFALDRHTTLLGLLSEFGIIHLPALVHFPHHGTFRITTADQRVALDFDATRRKDSFIRVSLPPADAGQTDPSKLLKSDV